MKEELIKFLMVHYSKYKVSQEGASLLIEAADLAHIENQVLHF